MEMRVRHTTIYPDNRFSATDRAHPDLKITEAHPISSINLPSTSTSWTSIPPVSPPPPFHIRNQLTPPAALHDPSLFAHCWRRNSCGSCLSTPLPCGWCPTVPPLPNPHSSHSLTPNRVKHASLRPMVSSPLSPTPTSVPPPLSASSSARAPSAVPCPR